MKRVFILALTLSLLLSCVPLAAYAQGTTPAGTAITDAAGFEAIANDPDGTYYLANDINFEGKAYPNYIVQSFSGTLDGQGNKLYNFSLGTGATDSLVGVFGKLGESQNTVIKNVSIGDSTTLISVVPADTLSTTGNYGVLAGKQNSSTYTLTVENVHVYANAVCHSSKNYMLASGLIALVYNANIKNCSVNGTLSSRTAARWINSAGFIASFEGTTITISDCVNNIAITAYDTNTVRSAGIVGYAKTGTVTIENCANIASVDITPETFTSQRYLKNAFAGGILGEAEVAVEVTSCINIGSVTNRAVIDPETTVLYAAGIGAHNKSASAYINCINYGIISTTATTSESPATLEAISGAIYAKDKTATSTFTGCFDATATPDANPATATVGIQEKAGANNTLDVRFVASVDSLEHQNVGVAGVAYWIEDGQVKTWSFRYNCQTVYKSIQASVNDTTVEYAAATYGANYLMALTIAGVPTDVNVTFKLTSFAEDASGAVVYGQTSEVKYENGTRVGA